MTRNHKARTSTAGKKPPGKIPLKTITITKSTTNSNSKTNSKSKRDSEAEDPSFVPEGEPEVIREAENQTANSNSNSNSVDDREASANQYTKTGKPRKKYSAMPEEEEDGETDGGTDGDENSDVVGEVELKEIDEELNFASGEDVFCEHKQMEMFQLDTDTIKARDPDKRISKMIKKFNKTGEREREEVYQVACRELTEILQERYIGESYQSVATKELKELVDKHSDGAFKLSSLECTVKKISNFDPATNTFQVEWCPTREPAEALATMDWCFVYASLVANDKVPTEILQKAYRAWAEARLALHPFANETYKDLDGKIRLRYPKSPKLAFKYSLRHVNTFNKQDMPQNAIHCFKRNLEQLKQQAAVIQHQKEKGNKVDKHKEQEVQQEIEKNKEVIEQLQDDIAKSNPEAMEAQKQAQEGQ